MIIRVALLASLVLVSQQAPAPPPLQPSQALKATIRLSVAKTDAAPGASGPYAAFGALIAQMLTPEGPADIRYTVSAEAMRADVDGRLAMFPRGTVLLQKLGAPSMQILNMAQKTWYELPAGQNLSAALGTPDIDIQPTSDRATIAGQRADRFTFTETLRMGSAQAMGLPEDFPKELVFRGDLWSTDAFADESYRAIAKTMQTFAAVPGIEALTAGNRFPLRLTLRSDLIAPYELRTEVTSITVAAADPALFAVPSDFQKVQPPVGGGEP